MRTILFVGLLLLPAIAHAESDVSVIGDWYTQGVENGTHAQFVIHNRANGTFEKNIRDSTHCDSLNEWTETGSWNFDSKHYVEVTQTVSGNPVDSSSTEYNDAFDYVRIDENHFTMHDPKTNIVWTMTRVSADYQMPLSNNCTV